LSFASLSPSSFSAQGSSTIISAFSHVGTHWRFENSQVLTNWRFTPQFPGEVSLAHFSGLEEVRQQIAAW